MCVYVYVGTWTFSEDHPRSRYRQLTWRGGKLVSHQSMNGILTHSQKSTLPGIEPGSPAFRAGVLTTTPQNRAIESFNITGGHCPYSQPIQDWPTFMRGLLCWCHSFVLTLFADNVEKLFKSIFILEHERSQTTLARGIGSWFEGGGSLLVIKVWMAY